MSVHLVGGGWAGLSETSNLFVAEAAARAQLADHGGLPRVAVVVVADEGAAEHAALIVAALTSTSVIEERLVLLGHAERIDPAVFDDVDAIVVGGGLTPAYHRSLEPAFDRIRAAVGDGTPYLGFSAGSMIAAEGAIIGGWRIGGVEVAPEPTSEDLDEVTVVPGIGLVDLSIDVHAAQWGTLSRLVAATAAGLVDGGVAIDEDTALVVGSDGAGVVGRGSLWRVAPGEQGVEVSVLSAVPS